MIGGSTVLSALRLASETSATRWPAVRSVRNASQRLDLRQLGHLQQAHLRRGLAQLLAGVRVRARSMMLVTRSRWLRPNTDAMPCSVTTALCWKLVTGSSMRGTIVETLAFLCHDGSAMNDWPPRECSAPTMKSVEPPKPE